MSVSIKNWVLSLAPPYPFAVPFPPPIVTLLTASTLLDKFQINVECTFTTSMQGERGVNCGPRGEISETRGCKGISLVRSVEGCKGLAIGALIDSRWVQGV